MCICNRNYVKIMNDKVMLCKHHHYNCNVPKCFRNKTASHNSRTLRKVISSKSLIQSGNNNVKSCSTGIISHQDKQRLSNSKPTTKSDRNFNKNVGRNYRKSELCTQCGDTLGKFQATTKSISKDIGIDLNDNMSRKSNHIDIKKQNIINLSNNKKSYKAIQQYYKNENFSHSSESVHASASRNKLKPSLSTIRETAEEPSSDLDCLKDVIYEIYPESTPEEMGYFDTETKDNIEKIKEFRRKNYFECHSAKSRISLKGSATSLGKHECLYRFYLNERLFPVPLDTDYDNNIRCIDCHLPVQKAKETSSCNGSIQAKVKVDDKTLDMILMLPVKEPLIIKEKRRELQKVVNPEVMYFGVIKLNSNGDSVFNSTLPSNSLALKYQKGYKEFVSSVTHKYDSVENGDVIII